VYAELLFDAPSTDLHRISTETEEAGAWPDMTVCSRDNSDEPAGLLVDTENSDLYGDAGKPFVPEPDGPSTCEHHAGEGGEPFYVNGEFLRQLCLH
jgi:hypothetical protein